VIRSELEFRWSRQAPVTLEDCLNRFPELGAAAALPVSLVYEEYRIRHRYGDCPALESYKQRFPDQYEALRGLVQSKPVVSCAPTKQTWTQGPESRNQTTQAPPPPQVLSTYDTLKLPQTNSPVTQGGRPSLVRVGGGYEMLHRIGQGQFGEVFKARAPGGGLVALKRIFRPLDDNATQRELRSLDLVCRLNHPFLLQTQLYWVDDGRLMIVMELADNSLADWLKECQKDGQTAIAVEPLLRYFTQAAEGLDFLHSQVPPVLHRDIKPANLLRVKGFAKVADFGLARETAAQGPGLAQVTTCGTPAFMPPEMWNGQVHINSDQYSLAVTYVEMRLGRNCVAGNNAFEVATKHMEGQFDLAGIPPSEEAVLRRALSREPDDRFPTCLAFTQALQEATASPKTVTPTPDRGIKVKVTVTSLAFALVAVLVALGVVLWWRNTQTPPNPQQPPLQVTTVDWQPEGWDPVNSQDIIPVGKRRYYKQLRHDFGGQTVIMVLIPQETVSDPPTFYIMQNKVWNDLYAAFLRYPASQNLFRKYSSYPGCENLVKGNWLKGAMAPALPAAAELGVTAERGRVPVFRATATEGLCLAEWMGGRLPNSEQFFKAADLDDLLPKTLNGDRNALAVNLGEGPWTVDRGDLDETKLGCRQLVSNGQEFTRNLHDSVANEELPLRGMTVRRQVRVVGVSYLAKEPATRASLYLPSSQDCTEPNAEIGFRVVLEQK
jgi:serine/threonine protein kinase